MFRLETKQLLLEWNSEVHPEDLPFPVNTTLTVKVRSFGFAGEAVLDLDVRQLAAFSLGLRQLYETLGGSARLEEPYGAHSFVEFLAGTGGHIRVHGRLRCGNGCGFAQELTFENKIDQTDLCSFAAALYDAYAEYAEG